MASPVAKFTSVLLCHGTAICAALAMDGLAESPSPVEARTPLFPDASVTRTRSPSGHPYMVGGIGLGSQQTMERLAGHYNLKLVFARHAGTLMAPNFLVIGSNRGLHVEKIWVSGPWFYIRLPAGAYTILARFDHQIVVLRNVYLKDGERKTYWMRAD